MANKSNALKRGDTAGPVVKPAAKPIAVPRSLPGSDDAGFDRLIYERVRLGIMSALAMNERLTFNELKSLFDVSDGNLGAHARKLEEADYVVCTKSFEGRRPKSEYRITQRGKKLCYATSSISRPSSRPRGAPEVRYAHRNHHGRKRPLATQRGLPRTAGHIEGAKAVRVAVETAARSDVKTLTLYAFSAANWARPSAEITALMRLFGQYLFTETRRCVEQSIRVNVIGRRDRLSDNLLRSIEQSERSSAGGSGMHLRIAVDYSSRHSIVEAAKRAVSRDLSADDFHRLLNEVDHSTQPIDAVDLLIRTGNERRLSDFLLWECAFAELHFSECLWPDFDERRFRLALEDYNSRQRRFGSLASQSL